MIALSHSWGALFFCFVSILLNFGDGVKGKRCLSYEALKYRELENGNCEELVHGTYEKYRNVQLDAPRPYWSYFWRPLWWCSFAALCLNQTSEWEKLCSRKFRWFRYSQFDISAVQDRVNESYVRNMHVKYCNHNYLDRNTARFTFSIRTTGFRCQSGKATNVPCSGKWIYWNKCDQLINGTNSIWYKIYSRSYWCQSFKTCFNSQTLKDRCRRDLRFYRDHFWYSKYPEPAFTSEVSSYISNTRIQIYPCSDPYIFGVNVIRCDSVAKNNGSAVHSVDSDGDDYEEDDMDFNLNTEMINALSEIDVQTNGSLQEAVKVFDAKINEYINRTLVSGKSSNKTRQEMMADILMATVAFEEFALQFGQHHITHSLPLVKLTSKTIG